MINSIIIYDNQLLGEVKIEKQNNNKKQTMVSNEQVDIQSRINNVNENNDNNENNSDNNNQINDNDDNNNNNIDGNINNNDDIVNNINIINNDNIINSNIPYSNDVLRIPTTKEEDEALIKFKEEIQKNNLIYNSSIVDDNYLIRFLRARKLDIPKTMGMFQKYVDWRANNDIDNIKSWDFKELHDVLSVYPKGFHKTDKLGRPIHYELLGSVNLEQLLKLTSFDRMLKYNIQMVDNLINVKFPICSKAAGRNVSQFINIIDLKNLSYKLISKKIYDYIRNDSDIMQNNFPEVLGKLYILNTGILFNAVWAVIKTFLDEKTKKKVIFPGSKYLKDLVKDVSLIFVINFL